MLAPGERPSLRLRRGKGARLALGDGREVVDAGSISAALLGHAHPDLVRAVEQGARAPYASEGYGQDLREQAAEDLLDIAFADEPWAAAVRFCHSASEANDLALSLARTLTGRMPLVARRLGYHGGLGIAREVSDSPLWSGALASRDGGYAVPPDAQRAVRLLPATPTPALGSGDRCELEPYLQGLDETLEGAAALITDYGSNGLVFLPGEYQDAAAAAARRAGALWIADEAVTGLGRLGQGFAFQNGESRPDIVTLGKGLSGGAAPAGAVVLSRTAVDLMAGRRWMTMSTFRGHPVSAATVSATVRAIDQGGLVAEAAKSGRWLVEKLLPIADTHQCVAGIRAHGLYVSIELRGDEQHEFTRWHGDGSITPLAEAIGAAALDNGALIPAFSGHTLWLVPSLIITRTELETVLHALDAALATGDALIERSDVATAAADKTSMGEPSPGERPAESIGSTAKYRGARPNA